MAKEKFVGEYEMRASKKMLFPFLSSASGLSQWFADDVNIQGEDKIYSFIWDGEENLAKMTSMRMNHHVKFEFLNESGAEIDDPNYVEFVLDINELTDTTFVRVTDYSDMEAEEAQELWDGLIHDLKEIVGG
jgi:uncharacterized protein YndB with AHSA1/START domain